VEYTVLSGNRIWLTRIVSQAIHRLTLLFSVDESCQQIGIKIQDLCGDDWFLISGFCNGEKAPFRPFN
jgi:hypothetical protein